MEFLKASELSLNPANYLISTKTEKPVTHNAFVMQQRSAEYVVKLAEAIKDKNFTPGKVDDLNAIKQQVLNSINSANTREYASIPKEPVSKVHAELTQHALDFASFLKKKEKTNVVNELMNQYNKIDDVEKVGEYFQEDLVQLNKIYTIKEILAAVKITTEKLG